MTLDGKTLRFTLKEPFEAIQNMSKSMNWLYLVEILRQNYYQSVISISREVSIAKGYLGTTSTVLVQA